MSSNFRQIGLVLCTLILVSCHAQTQEKSPTSSRNQSDTANISNSKRAIKVDVATAALSNLSTPKKYTGTTQPQKEVSWRSQIEGTLIELSVRVGDRVNRGQLLGRLDERILATDVAGKTAELAALKSELAQAKIQVKNAQIELEEAQIQWQQAESEATRYQELAKTGLIPDQQAESFKTAAKIARKSVLTAREAIKLEEQAVAIVRGRIASQQSAIADSQLRQTYSQIIAPIDGIVTARSIEPGGLIRAGEQVVTIGDFSQVKIVVPLSELDLDALRVGQQVDISLDAFPDRNWQGTVQRIAPTTIASSRQIPVEIVADNPEGQIKGGLLARITFTSPQEDRIIVPESAVRGENGTNYLFTVTENNPGRAEVTKQKVILGKRTNGLVEILAGISPGQKYVVRSEKPLQDRDSVGLSIISQ